MKKLTFDLNTPLFRLTAGEFLELLECAQKPEVVDTTKDETKYVYGLAGIAELLGCSKTQASRIKQSGKIDGAITQVGNLIITEAEKALELAGKANNKLSKR